MEKHWMDYVADLISGRVHNTFEALGHEIADLKAAYLDLENEMTQTEQTILNAAHQIEENNATITAGVQALRDKIAALPNVTEADFAEELTMLSNAVAGQSMIAGAMKDTLPADATEAPVEGSVADPTIDYSNPAVTPLGSATDAGVPTEVPAPGVPVVDPAVTPLAEDASSEANDSIAPYVDPETTEEVPFEEVIEDPTVPVEETVLVIEDPGPPVEASTDPVIFTDPAPVPSEQPGEEEDTLPTTPVDDFD